MQIQWISNKNIFFFLFINLFFISSVVSENKYNIISSIKNAANNVDSCFNDLGSTLYLPDHTLSWIFGIATIIATPFIIYKTYCYIDQFLLDRKPDSYIIKRSNNVLNALATEFDNMFIYAENINATDLNANEKIIAKFFFKEALIKVSTDIYPFLNYKLDIDTAISRILREQEILQRRIMRINNRAIENAILSDSDKDCIDILSTIHNSLEVLKIKLLSLQEEVITCYEYSNDLMHKDSDIMNTALLANQTILYAQSA